ncbi:alanine--tRNA ligase [Spiribacter vilamensis]|uniref:Alanine--tRNA ligase n=1 Tax=Spiribacter vilamensis TaxID=531306 RepID=A0A4Q8CZZ3_9GAMM|nr:alanine--tRNA ligase [Spiribacter vilamensis]RZU98621.1 alanyl-tRNA synthetase [Spiribacter vilamensis]TVO60121.1 alanine--tRNA ligase [Spiribacter vilamensis]
MNNSSAAIRQAFHEFFAERGHTIVPSASLVPPDDPTLLFINAGMVPFKDVFVGREQRPYQRAVSAQRCVRAGGKHNDLENVGYTARHHTFFEMLGNFSFGDYFKRDAIGYAWTFLTETLGLPAERLWVTVYEDDDEAASIWLDEIGVDPSRFARIGAADNFWAMGDTGPCGPCSEIFYDHGPEVPGGPPGSPDEDGDRYVEIWNLVFMQYDRGADGALTPLPKPSIDTGMGLERMAAVAQGVTNNYDIDLFRNLVDATARLVGTDDREGSSLRVIADHIRACAFLVVDGVLPSNEGRGYVLRRIIRRAVRHGYKLGVSEVFFWRLVEPLVGEMGEAYPELASHRELVERVLRLEEGRFRETLEQGLRLLENDLADLSGDTVPGETVFKLYDTFGFPVDLTADVVREQGLYLDMAGFETAMNAQRERARAASTFRAEYGGAADFGGTTEFSGYDVREDAAQVIGLYRDGGAVDALSPGDHGLVILDRTPFYAEAGGQVGDTGHLVASGVEFTVEDTQKYAQARGHLGRMVSGELRLGDAVDARIDVARRDRITLNHTATHLLHAALREVLGAHIHQKGSLVAPERLRFDFAHFEPITADQLRDIEARVNAWIRRDEVADIFEAEYNEAIGMGAMALFGEKYGDRVRVVRFGDLSTELCGGCHVGATGRIGLFRLTTEGGVSAGVRRIEAITGAAAVERVQRDAQTLDEAAAKLKVSPDNLLVRLDQDIDKLRSLERELGRMKQRLASQAGSELADSAQTVNGVKVLAARVDSAGESLRDTVDQLKNKLGSAVIVIAADQDGKVRLVAGVTTDLTDRLRAGDLVNHVARQVGGRGGGRPDFAQAGGSDPAALPAALESVTDWVQEQLNQ